MSKIKHIAIATQDAVKTARFYTEVFGLKEIAKLDSPNASGYYLSDGHINLAILNFKNDDVAGPEYGVGYSGLHHIGFEVESLEETGKKLADAGSRPREEINRALGVGMDGPRRGNVEVKYAGPDGIILDISETGWAGRFRIGPLQAARASGAQRRAISNQPASLLAAAPNGAIHPPPDGADGSLFEGAGKVAAGWTFIMNASTPP